MLCVIVTQNRSLLIDAITIIHRKEVKINGKASNKSHRK